MLSTFTSRRPFSRLRAVAAAALAFTTLTAATCGDDDEDGTPIGTYQLEGVAAGNTSIFIDPSTAPAFACGTANGANQECLFESGALTLNSNGSFSISVQGRQRPTGTTGTGNSISFVTPASATGTWAQSGSTITFTPSVQGTGTYTGTLSGDAEELIVNATLTNNTTYRLRFEK